MKSNLTLLYVEDDQVIRENYTEIFQNYFSTVLVATNGNDALELYNDNKIDIGIFDISLPGINGLNLTSKIREVDEGMEIIIISAHSDKEKLLKAVSLKLFKYLIKPVAHSELIEAIENSIDKKSSSTNILLVNNYVWNSKTRTLFYKNKVVKVSKKEIQIIDILLKNKTSYLSASEIGEYMYDGLSIKSDSNSKVVKILSRFKRKLNERSGDDEFFIKNCYGLGYKIVLK